MSSFKEFVPPATGTIVWTNLGAQDIERAKSFYGEIFKWNFLDTSHLPEDIRPKYAPYKAGSSAAPTGAITRVTDPSLSKLTTQNPGTATLYLIVDDLEETMKKIISHGGKEVSETKQIGVDFIQHFQDTEGNYVGMYKKGTPKQ